MVCSTQLHLEGPFPLDDTSQRGTQSSGERNLRDVTFSEPWRSPAALWASTGLSLAAVLAPGLAGAVTFHVGGQSGIHINDFSVPHRCPMWFSQDRNPTSIVIHIHVGQWDHHPSPPAHAEHRGGAGLCWQDTEGWGHQIREAHPVGGE